MTRPRWASVITTLPLFAWATTASAECGWVLWVESLNHHKIKDRDEGRRLYWDINGAHPTHATCESSLAQKLQQLADTRKGLGMEVRVEGNVTSATTIRGDD